MASRRFNTYATKAQIGKQFGVTADCVRDWLKNGAPCDTQMALAGWLVTRQVSDRVRAVAESILDVQPGSSGENGADDTSPEKEQVDELFLELAAGRKVEADGDSIAANMGQLELFRDFFAARTELAIKANRRQEIDYYSKKHREYEDSVNKAKLLAKKLGIDNGELLKKDAAENYARALAYWLCRCIDSMKRTAGPSLVLLPDVQAAERTLDGHLLASAFIQPLMRACVVNGNLVLPRWMIDTLRDAIDDYVEDGAQEVDKVIASEHAGAAPYA